MQPAYRAALGLSLAFLGYLWFRALSSFGFPALGPFALGANLVTLGLLLAAVGAAGMARQRGKRPLMAGFLLVAVGYTAMALTSSGGPVMLAHFLMWSSGVLGGWSAALRVLDPGSREAARFGQLRIASAAATAALALYVVLGLDDPVYIVAPILGTVGFALATSGFGGLRDAATAGDEGQRTHPAEALPTDASP